MNYRILIADGLAEAGLERLHQIPGVTVKEHGMIERSVLFEQLDQFDILIVRSRTQVDRELLEHSNSLKLVIRAGIGLDNIDVTAATDRGVVVMNAPTGNIVTTAEHALAMLFAVSRHIAQADASLRRGKWEKKKFQGSEIRGKTLGILGFGNIGKAVAQRAQGLQMRVICHDPFLSRDAAAKHGVSAVPFDELLKESDYVSIHVPLSDGTRGLIGREQLALMKPTAFLIQCARGGLVDEVAVAEALAEKRLAGAAFDVFEHEPIPQDHPFFSRPEVVLTPHLGASTEEAQIQVGLEVAEQVELFVREGAYKNAINVPNISGEQMERLRPYLALCEKMGAFAAQAFKVAPLKLTVKFYAIADAKDRGVMTLSVLKGFMEKSFSTSVNFVNARKVLTERGIEIEEIADETCRDYANMVEFRIVGENSQDHLVSGTLFGRSEPRLVQVDGFAIDAVLAGNALMTRNTDTPGVIGSLGSFLGDAGVNIARMHLGRKSRNGDAIAILSLDSQLGGELLERVRSIHGMKSAVPIKL